ncbi:hypothetical protein RZS28_03995 [Methylocapsa polymorpha]|uniref:Uncharacterized protein n=1 Tax=Methylocapsa polymorpha TaxID=3080828 RepID=A0ABZ0HUJ7_9HYPH|nr:hypothetical protein RZS28_03995 [Methylocapsa sp. RX1]
MNDRTMSSKSAGARLSRRKILSGLGSAAIAGGAVAATNNALGAENPDLELLRLGEEFAQAYAAERALEEREVPWPIFKEGMGRTDAIARRIAAIPTKTLEGMRVKARAIESYCGVWEAPGAKPEVQLYDSLVRDLIA